MDVGGVAVSLRWCSVGWPRILIGVAAGGAAGTAVLVVEAVRTAVSVAGVMIGVIPAVVAASAAAMLGLLLIRLLTLIGLLGWMVVRIFPAVRRAAAATTPRSTATTSVIASR